MTRDEALKIVKEYDEEMRASRKREHDFVFQRTAAMATGHVGGYEEGFANGHLEGQDEGYGRGVRDSAKVCDDGDEDGSYFAAKILRKLLEKKPEQGVPIPGRE